MSVEAITWALSQQIKPSSAKFVLVALSNCADGRDFIAWPSVAYLVEATNQDRKTVQANLAHLRDLGFIEDTGERRGSTKQVIVYRLKTPENGGVNNSGKEAQKRNSTENGTVPFLDGKRPEIPSKEAQNSPERGPKTDHGTVRNRNRTVKEPSEGADAPSAPQNPVKTKTTKPSGTVTADQLVSEGVDRQVAEDWLKVRKAKDLPLTATAWNGIKAEAEKGGVAVADAVRIATENSWAGFKAIWLDRLKAEAGGAAASDADDLAFLKSWPGIVAKGNQLGLRQQEGEQPPHFKIRVLQAANLSPEQIARARADYGVNV
jgi:hypothetical protein